MLGKASAMVTVAAIASCGSSTRNHRASVKPLVAFTARVLAFNRVPIANRIVTLNCDGTRRRVRTDDGGVLTIRGAQRCSMIVAWFGVRRVIPLSKETIYGAGREVVLPPRYRLRLKLVRGDAPPQEFWIVEGGPTRRGALLRGGLLEIRGHTYKVASLSVGDKLALGQAIAWPKTPLRWYSGRVARPTRRFAATHSAVVNLLRRSYDAAYRDDVKTAAASLHAALSRSKGSWALDRDLAAEFSVTTIALAEAEFRSLLKLSRAAPSTARLKKAQAKVRETVTRFAAVARFRNARYKAWANARIGAAYAELAWCVATQPTPHKIRQLGPQAVEMFRDKLWQVTTFDRVQQLADEAFRRATKQARFRRFGALADIDTGRKALHAAHRIHVIGIKRDSWLPPDLR